MLWQFFTLYLNSYEPITKTEEQLHRIHKGLFNAAEEENPGKENNQGHQPAYDHIAASNGAGPDKGVAKTLNNCNHGIQDIIRPEPVRNLAQRIDDRRCIHPELDDKAHGEPEVLVFGCQG